MSKEEKVIEYRYQYTNQELFNIGLEIATARKKFDDLEAEKAKIVKEYNERIKAIDEIIQIMCFNRRREFELRKTKCTLTLDQTAKERCWICVETGEEILREPFQPGDEQRELFQ